MISGMYMGELIRQVLLDLMKDDLIFFNCNREKLLERGSFYTRFASEIESDPVGDYTRARMALQELEIDPGLYFSVSGVVAKLLVNSKMQSYLDFSLLPFWRNLPASSLRAGLETEVRFELLLTNMN